MIRSSISRKYLQQWSSIDICNCDVFPNWESFSGNSRKIQKKNIKIEVGYDTVRYFMFFLPFMSRVFWYFSDTYARIKSNVRSTLIFFFDRYTQVDIEFLVVVYTVFVCEAEVILLNVLCTQSNILSKPRFAFTDLCKW